MALANRIMSTKPNNMKKHIGIIGMALALAMPALAQQTAPVSNSERPAKEHHGEHEGNRFLDLPDITEAQKTQLKAIFQETKKANQPRNEEMKGLREKLRTLKQAEKPNQTEINNLIDKMNGLRAEMEKTRTAGELKAMSILTKEQQEALRAKAKEHMKNRKVHRSEERKQAAPQEKF
jgi:Spy/CpxP family protein refolding chaperone